MTEKKDYQSESIRLSKVIDIAVSAFKKHRPKDFTKDNVDHCINVYEGFKNNALNPEPKFKKLASLKYIEQDTFTFFKEGNGETVEYFWQQIAKENLGYIREDKLRKIIERGKIKGRIEYELVIDSIVAAEQEERITKQEAKQLSEMIGEFESRGKKKK